MAFSGTISQTTFNTRKVIDSAMRRCRLPAQSITSEHIAIAQDQLYLLLSALANDSPPLWCIEKQVYPLYEGVGGVTLDLGTVDVLNSNLRTLQPVNGTNTDAAASRTIDFSSATTVTTVGVKWSAASAPLALERSSDGVSWTVVQTETPSATAGQWTWFDLESAVAAQYFRVRATSGTLDFTTIFTGNTPSEIPLARLNRDDYTNLPNKTFLSSRPLQYWFDRQARQPVMRLWPVPNATAETYQIVLWRHRHIMDVGTTSQEIEVPQRWLDAIIASLAVKLAQEIVEVDPGILPTLDALATKAMYAAQAEERDHSPTYFTPNIGMYTR